MFPPVLINQTQVHPFRFPTFFSRSRFLQFFVATIPMERGAYRGRGRNSYGGGRGSYGGDRDGNGDHNSYGGGRGGYGGGRSS